MQVSVHGCDHGTQVPLHGPHPRPALCGLARDLQRGICFINRSTHTHYTTHLTPYFRLCQARLAPLLSYFSSYVCTSQHSHSATPAAAMAGGPLAVSPPIEAWIVPEGLGYAARVQEELGRDPRPEAVTAEQVLAARDLTSTPTLALALASALHFFD